MVEPEMSRAEAKRATDRLHVRRRLEEKGVEQVRLELVDNAGFNPFQLAVMREWLAEKAFEADAAQRAAVAQSEREARMEASNTESLRIARSAKNAAWAAAIAATIAIVVAVAMPFVSRG